MIVGSEIPLVVGSKGIGVSDEKTQFWEEQPYTILREATYDEWVEGLVSAGEDPTPHRAYAVGKYFYEISVD